MEEKRPNILFLLSDEHSYRFLSALGDSPEGEPAYTPNLDRLIREGTHYRQAYCQMPLCTPSRLCMLTGMEVQKAWAWSNCSILPPDLPTLPGTLTEAGYETCLVGKMHLGGSRQFGGFQHRPYGDLTGRTGHQLQETPEGYSGSNMQWRIENTGELAFPESVLQEQVVAQETISWIRDFRSQNKAKPWFLCASFSRPHFPLTAPKRWLDFYRERGITPPRIPPVGDTYDHPMCRGMREGFEVENLSKTDTERMRLGYFACVSFLDEIIGDLLCRLEYTGDLENTIIVYASDHGEMAGEHGSWWKHSFHESSVRIPMVISTPEQRAGVLPPQEVQTPVQLIDLYPTLCRLAGARYPENLDGRDLSDSLNKQVEPGLYPVVSDNLVPRWGKGSEFRAVRLGNYKYVRFRDGSEFFFDLEKDPHEQQDLIRRELNEAAAQQLNFLRQFVESTIDFDQAETLRLVTTRWLDEQYSLNGLKTQGNLYRFKDGRIVNGEDVVYNPIVVADNLTGILGEDWETNNQQGK